jgi:hypothetical protein
VVPADLISVYGRGLGSYYVMTIDCWYGFAAAMYGPIGEGFRGVYIWSWYVIAARFPFYHLLILTKAEFTRAQRNCIVRQEICLDHICVRRWQVCFHISFNSLSLLKDVQTETYMYITRKNRKYICVYVGGKFEADMHIFAPLKMAQYCFWPIIHALSGVDF